MYGQITNPSKTRTMVATLAPGRGDPGKVLRVAPGDTLATYGEPVWDRWTLTFEPEPRRGLMRFGR